MDPLGHATSALERQRWLDDYTDASLVATKLESAIKERDQRGRTGTLDAAALTKANHKLRAMVAELGERIRALHEAASQFDAQPSRYGLTDAEAARRIDMVDTLIKQKAELARLSRPRAVEGRSELMSSGGTGTTRKRATWEDPEDIETDTTRLLSTESVLHLQKETLRTQDDDLEALGSALVSQKHIGVAIGDELDEQIVMLDDLDDHVGSTHARITRARRAAARVRKGEKGCYCGCLVILLIILIIILANTGWGCLLLFSHEQCSE